jgi:adhesin transport system membrane fusion protein
MSTGMNVERWLGPARRVRDLLERIRLKLQPAVDRWLSGWRTDPDRAEADFVADADYYMIYQEPLRARILVKTLLVVLAVFIILAAVTKVDEITKGEGKVIPSRQQIGRAHV